MKLFINNRKLEKISVLVEWESYNWWLVFVMHWNSWNKDEKHIRKIIKSFLNNNICVVSFDTTNTFWESDWNYENATVTNYYEDLEDVIKWAENQSFYQEPFFLVGHSLWSMCISLYAEKFSNKVKGLAPISTVISWKLSIELWNRDMEEWKKNWYIIEKSEKSPTWFKKLKYSHIIDRLKYDLLENVDKLNMPVLMIVWDKDSSTPVIHQQILYDKLPWKKELHIIKWAPHVFKEEVHLEEIYNIINLWIKNTLNN